MKLIKISLFLFLVLSNIVFAAVVEKKDEKAKDKENIYTEDKQNIMITVDQPDFSLRLKSNPTTGYAWYLREYDNTLITPMKHRFEKPESHKLMGAPGFEVWTFKLKPAAFIVPQQTVLRMVYARPWQGADNSTQLVYRISTQGK